MALWPVCEHKIKIHLSIAVLLLMYMSQVWCLFLLIKYVKINSSEKYIYAGQEWKNLTTIATVTKRGANSHPYVQCH